MHKQGSESAVPILTSLAVCPRNVNFCTFISAASPAHVSVWRKWCCLSLRSRNKMFSINAAKSKRAAMGVHVQGKQATA